MGGSIAGETRKPSNTAEDPELQNVRKTAPKAEHAEGSQPNILDCRRAHVLTPEEKATIEAHAYDGSRNVPNPEDSS